MAVDAFDYRRMQKGVFTRNEQSNIGFNRYFKKGGRSRPAVLDVTALPSGVRGVPSPALADYPAWSQSCNWDPQTSDARGRTMTCAGALS